MGKDRRKDWRKGGRTTPRGTRPRHLRAVDDPSDGGSPVDDIIDGGGRDLLSERDPIAAETWASSILDAFEHARFQARLEGLDAPPFEEALLDRCRQRGDRRAAVVAISLAAVIGAPHDRLAAAAAAELSRGGVALPAWTAQVGHATPARGWIASDAFGDQDSLIVAFRQEGEDHDHALVVLVDHNLSGQAKDAWLGPDAEEVTAAWKASGPELEMDEAPLADVLNRLRDAMAMSDLWDGDTALRTEDFGRHRALIWARLRRAGLATGKPVEIEVTGDERDALVAEFMASPEGVTLAGQHEGVEVELVVHSIVDLRADDEGRPLRWSPIVAHVLLEDLAPRKLLLDADQASVLPEVVRAFVRFSGKRTGLDRVHIEATLRAVDEAEPTFVERFGDPAAAGPAKAVLAALQARGVDLSDMDAITKALNEDAPLKLPLAAPVQRRRVVDAPADVVADAALAPVLARFDALTEFYGQGRKLTQTGQPTLADARELVALLDTADRLDETIGDRTFRTRSATELPELGFTIRWALAAGALRKEHGKLRATASWAKLAGKPLQRWMKAADVLPSLGPLAAFRANNRYRDRDEILDEFAPDLIHMLPPDGLPFEAALDWVCDRADTEYEWLAPYMQDPDHRRSSLSWDLDLLVRIHGWAGAVDRIGATSEVDRYGTERRTGGTLHLTTVGRWWLGSP